MMERRGYHLYLGLHISNNLRLRLAMTLSTSFLGVTK